MNLRSHESPDIVYMLLEDFEKSRGVIQCTCIRESPERLKMFLGLQTSVLLLGSTLPE
jgi:hypothetical protein